MYLIDKSTRWQYIHVLEGINYHFGGLEWMRREEGM